MNCCITILILFFIWLKAQDKHLINQQLIYRKSRCPQFEFPVPASVWVGGAAVWGQWRFSWSWRGLSIKQDLCQEAETVLKDCLSPQLVPYMILQYRRLEKNTHFWCYCSGNNTYMAYSVWVKLRLNSDSWFTGTRRNNKGSIIINYVYSPSFCASEPNFTGLSL